MRPDFQVIANGADITAAIRDRLLSLSVTDESGVKSDRVAIEIDDRDQKVDFPDVGAKLNVSMGYVETGLVKMGIYFVDEVSVSGGLRSMSIKASATDFNSKISAPVEESWHDTTLGAILSKIAKRNGLTPKIDPEIASIKVAHEDQTESDIQFATRLAQENNGVAKVAMSNLVVNKRAPNTSQSGAPLPVVSVSGSQTTNWEATVAGRGEYGTVTAFWVNKEKNKKIEAKVGGGSGGRNYEMMTEFPDERSAKLAAKGKLASLKNGKKNFRIGSMPGNPSIMAEMILVASGFRSGVDGEWLIKRVEHRLGNNGYTTSVDCESPGGSRGQ